MPVLPIAPVDRDYDAAGYGAAAERPQVAKDNLISPLLGGGDVEKGPQPEPEPGPERGFLSDAAATTAAVAHQSADSLRRLKTWAVGTGPTSVRVLSFFSGVMLCTVAVFNAVVGNIFINFNLLKVIVDGLLFAGGLLIIVIDGPLTPFLPMVRSQLMIMSTVAGRGSHYH